MNVLVIAGTDTGIGKTVVTAALASLARAAGRNVAVVKPVQTGVGADEPGDIAEVQRLAEVEDVHELVRLPHPLAPATAARRVGAELPTVQAMADHIRGLRGRDLVLVEGSGGLLVELDDRGATLADLARALAAPVLVVARAGLGTLNHVALTCEALRCRDLACAGVVVGAWPERPDLAATCNLDDLERYARTALLGSMPENAGVLSPDAFLDAARRGLARAALLLDAQAANPRTAEAVA
jgi:dethiobiotin synthetase